MDNPDDLQALDAVWEETPVTFGQPDLNDPCSGMLTRNMPTGDLQHAERMVRAQLQAIPEHDAMGRPVDSPAMPQGPYGPLAQAAGQEVQIGRASCREREGGGVVEETYKTNSEAQRLT